MALPTSTRDNVKRTEGRLHGDPLKVAKALANRCLLNGTDVK